VLQTDPSPRMREWITQDLFDPKLTGRGAPATYGYGPSTDSWLGRFCLRFQREACILPGVEPAL
jgi:hypothetical protein